VVIEAVNGFEMPNPITIRSADTADEARLAVLYARVRREDFAWKSGDAITLSDFDRDTDGEKIFVADVHGEIVGFVSVWLADRFIHHLYVDKRYRRLGVATRLLGMAVTVAGLPVRLKCQTRSLAAMAMYERFGWKRVGEGGEAGREFVELEYGG